MGRGADLFSFLCCSIWWEVRGAHLFSFLCCGTWWWVRGARSEEHTSVFESVGLIFLVVCVVVFGGGSCGAHLFSFLCCGI